MDCFEARKQLYEKIDRESKKYNDINLDLEIRIKSVLEECGIDTDIMNNVYIGKEVKLPGVFGCYMTDGKLISYVTNERAEIFSREHADFAAFMMMFIRTAPISKLYHTYGN